MEQTKIESLVETSTDMATGVFISWTVMLWVIPLLFPGYVTTNQAGAAFGVVMVFTVSSFIRRYCVRRMFVNKVFHKGVKATARFLRFQFNL